MISSPGFLDQEQSNELQSREGIQHLRFRVPSGKDFVLPAAYIRQVVAPSPDQITVMPNVSSHILGAYNLRGQVIWVVDVGQFLEGDESPPLKTDIPEISVLAIEAMNIIVGLAVERIGDIDWLKIEEMQLAKNLPPTLATYVQGMWIIGSDSPTPVYLLDPERIIQSARWVRS